MSIIVVICGISLSDRVGRGVSDTTPSGSAVGAANDVTAVTGDAVTGDAVKICRGGVGDRGVSVVVNVDLNLPMIGEINWPMRVQSSESVLPILLKDIYLLQKFIIGAK
jgi:hypothetical protein